VRVNPPVDGPRSRTAHDLDNAQGAFKHLRRAVVPRRTLDGIDPEPSCHPHRPAATGDAQDGARTSALAEVGPP
jgi:hypothetical protein